MFSHRLRAVRGVAIAIDLVFPELQSSLLSRSQIAVVPSLPTGYGELH